MIVDSFLILYLALNECFIRMGDLGTVALSGFMLTVGAPGLEVVYVYLRHYSATNNKWEWQLFKTLFSNKYDFDVMTQGRILLHRENFGTYVFIVCTFCIRLVFLSFFFASLTVFSCRAVSQSGRHIVVGAPFGDYDNIATYLTEINWETEGTDIFATGRGQAYTFFSRPSQQVRITFLFV